MLKHLCLLMMMIFCMLGSALAKTPYIPEALKPWQAWVLWEYEAEVYCPVMQGLDEHNCVWPGKLTVNIQGNQANFTLKAKIFFDSWLQLPGDNASVPFNVKINDKLVPVVFLDEPAVFLNAGEYEIKGELNWQTKPNYLKIPKEIGLLALTVDDHLIPEMNRDLDGKLWLTERQITSQHEENSESIQVFRFLKDDNPFIIDTVLNLKIAGQDREIFLSSPLLTDFIPLDFQSDLPARLEADGRLRVQIRAGTWAIRVKARYNLPLTELAFVSLPAPWPKKEIWVFEPVPELRMVEVSGGQSIDPTQSELPDDKKQFQSFLMEKDQKLMFKQKQRGQATKRADQLELNRTMWLDFSGKNFTIQDIFSGQLEQKWRLEALPDMQVGRVQINDTDRLITVGPTGQSGVELRQGKLNLLAVSEMPWQSKKFSAIGWEPNVQRLKMTLQLPPGWHLLAATGVDRVNAAWIDKWNLLDLFLVLVIAAAVFKLFNFRWGLVALFTLVLIYHERGAPIYTWINVIASVALLRVVLSTHKMQFFVKWYYRGSVLLLVLYAIPFAVEQVRHGMYAQLTQPNYKQDYIAADVESRQTLESFKISPMLMRAAPMGAVPTIQKKSNTLEDYDPNAKIQMGPGLPNWKWESIDLMWNGPVIKEQMLGLWLISPLVSSILNFLRVFMMGTLLWGLLKKLNSVCSLFVSACLIAGLLSYSPHSIASEIPEESILAELKARLLAPEVCSPHCASIGRMSIAADLNQLKVRMDVNALSAIAIPIPSALGKWSPQIVMVDGQQNTNLFVKEQILYIALESGVHTIELVGIMPELQSFELQMPIPPTSIQMEVAGWSIEGITEGILNSNILYFKRLVAQGSIIEKLKPGEMPVFASVVRQLNLGFSWKTITTVERISPQRGNASFLIPLLPGEHVLNHDIKIKNNSALISFSENQFTISYESELPVTPMLALKSDHNLDFSETWLLNANSVWHIDFQGIPAIHQSVNGEWQPSWKPWPGEEVILNITRPEAKAGATMSIDKSTLILSPGKRAMDGELSLNVRTSQGGVHVLTLPQGVILKDLRINNKSQLINLQGQQLSLPIYPGSQTITLKWQMPFELKYLFQTPTIHLNAKSTNETLIVKLGRDRWILALGGPTMGPVVLFWGILIIVIMGAFVLNRLNVAPLNFWQWALLGVGLSFASYWAVIGVFVWFLVMGRSEQCKAYFKSWGYTLWQIALVCLTFVFIGCLLNSISNGLLGTPQMQLGMPVNGLFYNSNFHDHYYELSWYQDQSMATTPKAWILTLSMYWYRALMLVWALWLAFSIIGWLKWGWQCFSRDGLWVKVKL